MDDALALWEALLEAGSDRGVVPGRHRRLRHDRPHREGLPRLRRRARRRAQHRRGRHAAPQGQGRRLRRAARPTSPSGRQPVPKTVLCTTDRRRPHLGIRHEALHARRRADPHPRRRHPHRRPRPPPLRDQRRIRALAGQARAAGLPARRRGPDRQRARRVLHGGALPGHRRLRRRRPASSTPPNERMR